jgi:hypothetical protein
MIFANLMAKYFISNGFAQKVSFAWKVGDLPKK